MKRFFPIIATVALLAGCTGSPEPAGPATSTTATLTSSATSTSKPTPISSATSSIPVSTQAPVQEQQPIPDPDQDEYVSPAAPAQPTFNPDSADGYGPDQALPPFCERFPHDQSCQPPAAVEECIGFGCSPEQDAELAEMEGDATAKFWDCMAAGGTEQTCLQ